MRKITCATLGLILIVGCGKKNPVTEVSLSQSGIEVVEASPTATGGDWSGWRGPSGNGIAPADTSVVTKWNESTNVKWRSKIPGRGHSSPIVAGDSIFLATALDKAQQQIVIAIDREDGSEKWQTVIHEGGFPSKGQVHRKATNANGTLASDGKALYTAFLNSDAIIATAIDLDGDILWQREIGKFVSKFGYAPSPVIYKSLVIFAADNQGGGYIAAVDSKSGEVAWRVARGNASSYSSPAVFQVGGKDQLVISGCDAVTSYDPATGDQLWRTPCIAEATCGTVIAAGDRFFAAGGYPDKETVCLSSEGKQLWSNRTKVYEPSLVLAGENLVAVNDDGIAFCWKADTGDSVWKERLGGNFSSSPVVCNGLVYASNLNGETFVFRAGDKFELVAKNRLGDDCYASPAVSGSEMFLRIGIGREASRREELVCLASPPESDKGDSE